MGWLLHHVSLYADGILVLQRPEVPLGRVSLELQLESLVVADLVLVRCHVHPCADVLSLFRISSLTYAARDKSLIAKCLEACLGLRVLQRKLFRLGHRVGPEPDLQNLIQENEELFSERVNMRDETEHTQWPDCQTWGKDKLAGRRFGGRSANFRIITWT